MIRILLLLVALAYPKTEIGNIFFLIGSDNIDDEVRTMFAADALLKRIGQRCEFVGYISPNEKAYGDSLAWRRAREVRAYMTYAGFPRDSITLVDGGAARFERGDKWSRRVQIFCVEN